MARSAGAGLTRRDTLRLLGLTAVTSGIGLLLAGCGGGGGGGGAGGGGSATVTGMVLDSANADQAVGGATVVIGGATAVTTTTDQASSNNLVGSFTLTNVKVGSTTATVTPPGGTAQTIAFSPAIAPGANSALELIINIGQIEGKVLLPNGQPAASAFVAISVNGDNTTTASDGTFLLINVPLGATQLTAVLGTASVTQTVTVGNGVTGPLTLQLVDDPNPNPPSIPETLAGKVILGGGTGAAPDTQVTLFRNGIQIEQTNTDANGAYSFYVPVGTYTLQFQRTAFQTATAGPVTIVDPSTVLTVPDVTMQPNV